MTASNGCIDVTMKKINRKNTMSTIAVMSIKSPCFALGRKQKQRAIGRRLVVRRVDDCFAAASGSISDAIVRGRHGDLRAAIRALQLPPASVGLARQAFCRTVCI